MRRSRLTIAFFSALFLLAAVVLATLSIFALRPALEPRQLAGTYSCTYPYGVETLTLNSNSSYSQSFKFYTGRVLTNAGTWTMDTSKGELVLFNAVTVDTGSGTPRSTFDRATWSMEIRRSVFGKISFTWGVDIIFEYQ